MNPTKQTKARAEEIVSFLEAHPERHDQDVVWGSVEEGDLELAEMDKAIEEENFCGTTLCIAGSAIMFTDGPIALRSTIAGDSDVSWDARARELLGLTPVEASRLFYSTSESKALEMTKAIAEGDEQKFNDIYFGER